MSPDPPAIRVYAESERASLELTVVPMQTMDELEAYLDENGVLPTLDEAYTIIDDHTPALDYREIEDLPTGIILDLVAHITPDPPCGPHPDE